MTEIPFVTALGDALEVAIAQPARRRRPLTRRRLLLVAVAALALAGAGLAIARLVTSPDKLAAESVGCYDRVSLDANVSVPGGVGSPLDVCAAVYRAAGKPVPSLVACDSGAAVAVFPGSGPEVCRRLGLRPLAAGYAPARARVARLERDVIAIERTADCIPARALARRVDALLVRTGWVGWRTELRLDGPGFSGPCGAVTALGGDGRASISGSLDADRRRVMVIGAPYRSTLRFLYGDDGLAGRLMDASTARCYTIEAIEAHARRQAAGREMTFTLHASLPPNSEFDDPARQQRYEAGCALVEGVSAASDGRGVVVELLRKR